MVRVYLFTFLLICSLDAIAQTAITKPDQPIAIIHATVLNVVTTKEEPDQTIIIDSNRIVAKGDFKKIKVPANSIVIDGTGRFIMPGLTDAHIHFFQSGGLYTRPDGLNLNAIYPYEKDQQWILENLDDQMARYLACGITKVIDVGGPFSNYTVRDLVNKNIKAPTAFVTGPLISTYLPNNLDKKDPPIVKVTSPEEAKALVKRQVPYHPDFIKIWYIVLPGEKAESNLPIVKAAIEESHANGLKVAVHATEHETAKLAVKAGADILVHSVDDQLLDKEMIELLRSRQIVYIPTLLVAQNYSRTFSQQFNFTAHDFKYANPFMLGTLMDIMHIETDKMPFDYKKMRERYHIPSKEDTVMALNLKAVQQNGGRVVSGTDAGNIGTLHASSHLAELLAMKNAGMTNWEILQSSTINAANGFGKDRDYGSIEKGKVADMLILAKNPVSDLSALENIQTIVHRGIPMTPEQLLPVTPAILVQQQLNAYNARDLEAFLEPYADSVELYEYPDKLTSQGKEQMRKDYAFLKTVAELHCQVTQRIIEDHNIVDHESVTAGENFKPVTAIAIYHIENGKIVKVLFMK